MKQNRKTEKFLINRDRVKQIHDDFSEIAVLDEHAKDGIYRVRSVYFDNDNLEALKDRIAQKDNRKKFRIRLYNDNPDFIRLEEKVKVGDIGTKSNTRLTYEEVEKILNGDVDWIKQKDNSLLEEFYEFIKNDQIHPMVIIEYIREPYTIPEEDIRLTLDYDVKVSEDTQNFLDPELPLVDHIKDQAIIEVKWPDKLPEKVENIIQREDLSPVNFSKYTSTYDLLKNDEE